MTLEEWVKKNKPQQYQQLQKQPTKTFRENVTGVKTAAQPLSEKTKAIIASGKQVKTAEQPKTPMLPAGHLGRLGLSSTDALATTPALQRDAARTAAIGYNIVGGLVSAYETYATKVKDNEANARVLPQHTDTQRNLKLAIQRRNRLKSVARTYGMEEAQKRTGLNQKEVEDRYNKLKTEHDKYIQKSVVDQNSYGQRTLEKAAQKTQEAKKGLGPVGSFLSDTTISIGSSAPGVGISLLGAPEVGLPLLGAQAAGQKAHELSKRGYTADVALQRGLGAGLIEAGTEAVPVGRLASVIAKKGGKKILKSLVERGVEATGEGLAYTANYLADSAAKDPEAKFSLTDLKRNMLTAAVSGAVVGGIPGVSMALPKKLNKFGEPIMQSQGRNLAARAFENFLSPGKLTTLQHKEVYEELDRLYQQTGSPSVFPRVAEKSFDVNGKKVILSAKDYETFARTQGEIVNKNLKALIQSKEYAKMSDEKKAESIAFLYNYANAIAKSKVDGSGGYK